MFYIQQMAKQAIGIELNRSKLHNIQNLATFSAISWQFYMLKNKYQS